MLEPRTAALWLKTQPHMKYLGGTADFDLWWRDDQSAATPPPNPDILPYIRVVRVVHTSSHYDPMWDDFRVPLYLNVELNSHRRPEERRLAGRWSDIHLTHAELDEIETYLRCFAPWALGEED